MPPASREQLPRFQLRDAADIHRLFNHLLTHRRLPRVEFEVAGLHVLHSQRAQDRFARLAEACNCLIGEVMAAATFVGGSYVIWTTFRGWPAMGMVVVATLLAGASGKAIELLWTRARLLLVLRDLARRLGTAEGSPERDYAVPAMAPAASQPRHARTQNRRSVGPSHAARKRHSRVVLREPVDIDRLFIQVVTRWALPRIEVDVAGASSLPVQRAQHRIARYSRGCSFLPAAFMAAAVLLGGLLYIVWTQSKAWYVSERADWWLLGLDWSDIWPVALAAAGAAVVGTWMEKAWLRLRLLLVLRGLRDQLG